jgi:hypothetical protein
MEMPITKPSIVSYADELNFNQLEDDLNNKQHNGFIRITAGSEEGYILYKNGKQVAASYDRFSKSEALEKIELSLAEKNTLIEVFDIRPSQVDYLLELNQPYTIKKESKTLDIIGELKKPGTISEPEPESVSESVPEPESVSESVPEPESVSESESVPEPDSESESVPEPEPDSESIPEPEPDSESIPEPESVSESVSKSDSLENGTLENGVVHENTDLPKNKLEEEKINSTLDVIETKESESFENLNIKNAVKNQEITLDTLSDKPGKPIQTVTPETSQNTISEVQKVNVGSKDTPGIVESDEVSQKIDEEPFADRSELLKKYGIKDIEEKDVEHLLESYKGGSINADDAEKIELTLMNRIKKSVLGIPKIQGTEVMVFLDTYHDLTGTINIITEYESQGIFSRIIGQSKTFDNLRRQIINIAEIEIKKSFRQYPDVVDKFDINVEFS